MKFYDACAGIGAFRLALERLGHTCVGGCEIDKYARETYKKNFGEYPTHTDITKLDAKEVPDHEIFCCGFPCPTFSIAGKRLGFQDHRGEIFFEILRIAREKRPKLLFLENVTGLLNHDEGRTFGTMLVYLDELGYEYEWQVFNSKDFVPQNRERVFIVGHLRDKPTPKIFPIREINQVDDGSRRKAQKKGKRVRSSLSNTIDANYAKGGGSRTMILVQNAEYPTNRIYSDEGISPTLVTSGGGRHIPMIFISNINANMNNRIQDREETWTLTTRKNEFGIMEGNKVRSLTPLECERLQGFPDGWTEGVSDTQRYRQLGNAVTVPVVEFIARRFSN